MVCVLLPILYIMPHTNCQVHLLPQMVEAGQPQLQFHVLNGKDTDVIQWSPDPEFMALLDVSGFTCTPTWKTGCTKLELYHFKQLFVIKLLFLNFYPGLGKYTYW